MILKIIYWILRLFAWPWAVRSVEGWQAAPVKNCLTGTNREPSVAPPVDGTGVVHTAEDEQDAVDGRFRAGHPLSS